MRSGSTRRTFWVFAVLVLVVAAETRFLGLSRHSLWFDEAYSVSRAETSLSSMVRFVRDNDTHPPLYYAVLGAWVRLFGTSESAVRSLSAVAGFLSVPLLYAFARTMVDADVALTAAALLAGSALAVLASQEARMYPLLGFFTLVSWYSLRQAVQHRRGWCWVGYVSSAALMLYTHYFGFLVLGSQALYVIPLARRDRRLLLAAALALGTVVVAFLPWVPAFVVQATSGRGTPTFRPPVDVDRIVDLVGLFGFGGELLGTGGYFHTGVLPLWQAALITLPFLGLLGAGAIALRGERAWCLLCFLVVPIALVMGVSTRFNIFYGRYFSFLTPAFAMLMTSGLDQAANGILRRDGLRAIQKPVLMAGGVVFLMVANAPVLNGYKWHGVGDYNWRGAAELVSRTAGPNDYLLFVPGFARVPFEYYYKGPLGRQELTPVEEYRMVRMKAPTPKVDKAWARRLAEVHPHLWIVATSPVPGPAYLRLEALLDDSFESRRVWDFNSVYVFSLTSRLYGGGAGSQ